MQAITPSVCGGSAFVEGCCRNTDLCRGNIQLLPVVAAVRECVQVYRDGLSRPGSTTQANYLLVFALGT